jgi:hypothetical protein
MSRVRTTDSCATCYGAFLFFVFYPFSHVLLSSWSDHWKWGIQSALSQDLYEYITIFAGCFTDSDSTLFRSKVVTCLGTMLTPDIGGAALQIAWEEAKTFCWQKYELSQLVQDLELGKWHANINLLKQSLEHCRSLEDTDINWMMEGLLEDPELGDPELDDPEFP